MAKKLFVGGLPWSVNSEHLESMFREYGDVLSAFVVKDRETGRSRGFGFVEMEADEAADKARAALDGGDMEGRTIKVDEARERPPRGDGY